MCHLSSAKHNYVIYIIHLKYKKVKGFLSFFTYSTILFACFFGRNRKNEKNFKKSQKTFKKVLTNGLTCGIIIPVASAASLWEHSSAGRASALQAEGHRFEPYCSHHDGPVAQLVRAPACHAGGRGFEPHPGRHHKYSPCCMPL